MWDRKQLKAQGKAAFKANYWRSVGAALLLAVATGAGTAASGRATTSNQELASQLNSLSEEQLFAVIAIVLSVVGVILLFSTIASIFILKPLEVGTRRFFLVNGEEPAGLGELAYGFRSGYLHTVGTMFLRDLFLALWACLFFIPGIVKAYSYRLVPYILAEHPEMSAQETITLSRQLMNGHKWNAFVLDLSFLGWEIVSCITLGLAGVFFVNPYVAATDAELYRVLREGR